MQRLASPHAFVHSQWASLPAVAGNVVGTYNVYEAARLAGVKRVVFASSGATIMGYEQDPPYSDIAAGNYDRVPSDIPQLTHGDVRPAGLYGAAKVWGELENSVAE